MPIITDNPPSARYDLGLAATPNGTLHVFGGWGGGREPEGVKAQLLKGSDLQVTAFIAGMKRQERRLYHCRTN